MKTKEMPTIVSFLFVLVFIFALYSTFSLLRNANKHVYKHPNCVEELLTNGLIISNVQRIDIQINKYFTVSQYLLRKEDVRITVIRNDDTKTIKILQIRSGSHVW